MDHISESARTRPTTAAIAAAPLAIAGGVAVAALATYLTRPGRRSSARDEQHQSLVAYLRDHLAGADAAIHVVRRLAATHEGSEDGRLFQQLAEEFAQDRTDCSSTARAVGRLCTVAEARRWACLSGSFGLRRWQQARTALAPTHA